MRIFANEKASRRTKDKVKYYCKGSDIVKVIEMSESSTLTSHNLNGRKCVLVESEASGDSENVDYFWLPVDEIEVF